MEGCVDFLINIVFLSFENLYKFLVILKKNGLEVDARIKSFFKPVIKSKLNINCSKIDLSIIYKSMEDEYVEPLFPECYCKNFNELENCKCNFKNKIKKKKNNFLNDFNQNRNNDFYKEIENNYCPNLNLKEIKLLDPDLDFFFNSKNIFNNLIKDKILKKLFYKLFKTNGINCIDKIAVSYTHLTLPTTPYV